MQRQFLFFLGMAAVAIAAGSAIVLYPKPQLTKKIITQPPMSTTTSSRVPADGKPAINNAVNTTWEGVKIKATNLPPGTYHTTRESKSGQYTVSLYLAYADEPLLYPYDVWVDVIVEKGATATAPTKCVEVKTAGEARSDREFDLGGGFKATVRERLNYHSTGNYGNPNPFTPELKEVLDKVWGGLTVGKCS